MQKHRENIKEILKIELGKAKNNILIAVCWFTDIDLFQIIYNKAKEGLLVEVILTNDDNNFEKSKINWFSFIDINGKVYKYKKGYLMHLKECIIDKKTFIEGTYNWTSNAKKNIESINIYYDNEFNITDTINEYNSIKQQCTLLTRDLGKNFKNAVIKNIEGKYGIFNTTTDDPYIPAIYNIIREPSDGMIYVQKANEGGFLNENLEFSIPLNKAYKECGDFIYGASLNIEKDKEWNHQKGFWDYPRRYTLILKNGKKVVDCVNDYEPIDTNTWFVNDKIYTFYINNDPEQYYIFKNVYRISNDLIDGFLFFKEKKFIFIDNKNKKSSIKKTIEQKDVKILNTYDFFINQKTITILCEHQKDNYIMLYDVNKDRCYFFKISLKLLDTLNYKSYDWKFYNDILIFNDFSFIYKTNENEYKKISFDTLKKNSIFFLCYYTNVYTYILTEKILYRLDVKENKIYQIINFINQKDYYFSSKDQFNDFRNYLNNNFSKTEIGYELIKSILYYIDNKKQKQDIIELFITKYKENIEKEKQQKLYLQQNPTPISSNVYYEKSFFDKLFSDYLIFVIIFIIIIMYNTCKN